MYGVTVRRRAASCRKSGPRVSPRYYPECPGRTRSAGEADVSSCCVIAYRPSAGRVFKTVLETDVARRPVRSAGPPPAETARRKRLIRLPSPLYDRYGNRSAAARNEIDRNFFTYKRRNNQSSVSRAVQKLTGIHCRRRTRPPGTPARPCEPLTTLKRLTHV
jgi:hypothetical protein